MCPNKNRLLDFRLGSCVTSNAGPHGDAQLYERWRRPLRVRQSGADLKAPQTRNARRALRLLASVPFGASETIMFAHGFTRQTLADLLRAGLATAERKTVKTTDAGRRALKGDTPRLACTRCPSLRYRRIHRIGRNGRQTAVRGVPYGGAPAETSYG